MAGRMRPVSPPVEAPRLMFETLDMTAIRFVFSSGRWRRMVGLGKGLAAVRSAAARQHARR